jgi:hypothetical protein
MEHHWKLGTRHILTRYGSVFGAKPSSPVANPRPWLIATVPSLLSASWLFQLVLAGALRPTRQWLIAKVPSFLSTSWFFQLVLTGALRHPILSSCCPPICTIVSQVIAGAELMKAGWEKTLLPPGYWRLKTNTAMTLTRFAEAKGTPITAYEVALDDMDAGKEMAAANEKKS